MREIKFRAWNKLHKYMTNDLSMNTYYNQQTFYYTDSEDGIRIDDEYWVLMQFTGLLDKNGRELYEGDLLIYEQTSIDGKNKFWTNFVSEVTWFESQCSFLLKRHAKNIEDLTKYKDYEFGLGFEVTWLASWRPFEIIGNIFENPELLN